MIQPTNFDSIGSVLTIDANGQQVTVHHPTESTYTFQAFIRGEQRYFATIEYVGVVDGDDGWFVERMPEDELFTSTKDWDDAVQYALVLLAGYYDSSN